MPTLRDLEINKPTSVPERVRFEYNRQESSNALVDGRIPAGMEDTGVEYSTGVFEDTRSRALNSRNYQVLGRKRDGGTRGRILREREPARTMQLEGSEGAMG